MELTPNTVSCPFITCSRSGCSCESNGIEPFRLCSDHYRRYVEWLAQRNRLETFIARSMHSGDLSGVLHADLTASGAVVSESEVAFMTRSRPIDSAGLVLDFIGAFSTRSTRACRLVSNQKETRRS